MLQSQSNGQNSARTIEEKFKSLTEEDYANLWCVVSRIMRNYKQSYWMSGGIPSYKVENLSISDCELRSIMALYHK
mgnify:CR=1 FL=1